MKELVGISSNPYFVMGSRKDQDQDKMSLIPMVELVINTTGLEYAYGDTVEGRTMIDKIAVIDTMRFSVNERSIRELIDRLIDIEGRMLELSEKFDQEIPMDDVGG